MTHHGAGDTKQPPGNVQHLFKLARYGHMDAVVIARREVERRKFAIDKALGQCLITAKQIAQCVVLLFGLNKPVVADGAKLTDNTVNRADDGMRIAGNRPNPGGEGAGEKGVEACVGITLGACRFA
jgi:hypothetical protein